MRAEIIVQVVLCLAASAGLYALWVRSVRHTAPAPVIGAGFVVRAFLACALFWISWLSLPFAPSLQLGGGLWFFGQDGIGYLAQVEKQIAEGIPAVLKGDRMIGSFGWVQVLAIARLLFGTAVSVACLVNLACYLLAALLLVKWGERTNRSRQAATVVALVSFSPGLVLWSTQPLKDTYFALLLIAFFHQLRALWEDDEARRGNRWPRILALAALLYLVVTVRWYFGVILWTAIIVVSVGMTMTHSKGVRERLVTGAVLTMALLLGMPGGPRQSLAMLVGLPVQAVSHLETAREGFETGYEASTEIAPGGLFGDSGLSRVAARGVMMFVPKFIASPLGLATAGGGKGLWVLADVDTLYFLFATVVVIRCFRNADLRRMAGSPVFLAISLTLLASLSMLYVVSNFGTLMRLRQLLFVPLVLIPLVLPLRESVSERGGGPELGPGKVDQ